MIDKNMTKDAENKVIIICIFTSILIFTIDSAIPLGVAGGVPYIIVVLFSLWSSNAKLPLYAAIATSILTIIGYFASPAGGELWKVLANRSLALFAIWVVAILSIQRKTIYEEKEKALSEVATLSGLLPICASCKNVKDDKGYWNQIESYIKEHSDAEFSHGYCPDCVKKLFPDLEVS